MKGFEHWNCYVDERKWTRGKKCCEKMKIIEYINGDVDEEIMKWKGKDMRIFKLTCEGKEKRYTRNQL